MGDVVGPHDPALMLPPMAPVVKEVPHHEGGNPGYDRARANVQDLVTIQETVDAPEDLGIEKIKGDISGEHRNIRSGIASFVADWD